MSFVLIVLYYKTLKLFFNEDFQAEKYNFLMDH